MSRVTSSFLSWALALALAAAWPAGAESNPEKIRRALALEQAGDVAAAEALFREVLREDPRHGTARLQLGRLALERGEWQAAREHLEVAVDSDPRRPYLAWYLLGQAQLLGREPDEARQSFSQALQRAPRFGPALVGRARASLLARDPEPALADLGEAAKLPATASEASLLAAQVLIYLDRVEDARRALDEPAQGDDGAAARLLLRSVGAPESAPESAAQQAERSLKVELGRHLDLAAGYLALGVFHLRQGRRERAEPPLRIALAMDDRNPMAELFLERARGERTRPSEPFPALAATMTAAVRHAADGSSAEARRRAAEILDRRPWFVPARLLLIDDAEGRDDLWQAMQGYRQLLEWLPGLPVLLARRARLAHAMGASELAEASAREALESLPHDGALRYLLASIQAAAGRVDDALASCRQALELGFRTSRVYLTLGDLHQRKMQVAQAIAAYAEAVDLDPAAAEVIPSFSLSALTAADFAALAALLEKHLASHPESVNTLYTLGLMRLREDDLGRAEGYFRALARLAPERSDAHYNLGLVLLRQGKESEGQAAMERFRALKAREDEEFERHNRAHFQRLEAQEALADGNTARAIEIYAAVVAAGLGQAADFLAVGEACLKAGDAARAFAWFERVLAAEPYDRQALAGLMRAAEALARPEVAAQCRERLELLAVTDPG